MPPMLEYSIYYPVVLLPEASEDWRRGKWTNMAWITQTQYLAQCRNMVAHGVTNPNIYESLIGRPGAWISGRWKRSSICANARA